MTAAWHGEPDVTWQLRRQFVKLQRGQQTKHGLRYFCGDGRKTFMFRHRIVGLAVEATSNPVQQASDKLIKS
ncbi:hypothetical protein AGMMS50289_21880 [Betaproteobacteria bacterium]|nr:hypothetical protein AGMMS50289_21880 [Betaproteobacteria bacterium]